VVEVGERRTFVQEDDLADYVESRKVRRGQQS
jgi:hypothetical protein